jgi:hypothetical protein
MNNKFSITRWFEIKNDEFFRRASGSRREECQGALLGQPQMLKLENDRLQPRSWELGSLNAFMRFKKVQRIPNQGKSGKIQKKNCRKPKRCK